MHLLLCSDGTPEAGTAVRFAAALVEAVGSRVTLLGVAEREEDRVPLTAAMEEQRDKFAELSGVRPELIVRAGEPTREILARTLLETYDLVVIGARRKAGSGTYWRSTRAYEIVRAVMPAVLVVVGRRERLERLLVCVGGERYLSPALELTARLAVPAGARVTLLHVLPEVPDKSTGLPRLPEDACREGPGDGEPGVDLPAAKARLVAAGVPVEAHLRRGSVLQEIAGELSGGDYDLVVTGTRLGAGPVREYELGDVTREIINRAGCPVLVVRANPPAAGEPGLPAGETPRGGLVDTLRGLFGSQQQP